MPLLAFACGLMALCQASRADLPSPRLTLVFPPGGQAGTEAEIRVVGSGLEGLSSLRFADPRITAVSTGNQRFTIRIPKDVPPGLYDLSAIGMNGISSPRSFFVSPRETIVEPETKGLPEKAHPARLDTTVCGIIEAPGVVDTYQFHASSGQRVVIETWAERLDSRLHPVLELLDDHGRRVATNRGYSGVDPLIDYRVAADGDLVLRVFDLTYSGGPEHVYRIDLDTGPRIEFALPTVVKRGETMRVTLFGRNLVDASASASNALDRVEWDLRAPDQDDSGALRTFLRPARVGAEAFPVDYPGAIGPVLVGLTDVPVVCDEGQNHQPKAAQSIPWPCEVSGQLAEGSERDWFSIRAHRGDVIWLELFGERIGAPVDLALSVFDGQGERELLHLTDCWDERGVGNITTTHSDPAGRWVAPADGDYLILVRNVIGGLGRDPRRVYRLSVRREEADFQVLAVPARGKDPSGFNVPRGGRALLELVALRRRGMSQPIRVSATDLPAGVECPDVWFGPGVDRVPLVVSANRDAGAFAGALNLMARADVGGLELVRKVQGATVISSAPPIPSARLTQEVPLATGPESPWTVTATPSRTIVSQGSVIDVALTFEMPRGSRTNPVTLSALGMPADRSDQVETVPASQPNGWFSVQVPDDLLPGPYTFTIQADTVLSIPGASPSAKPKDLLVSTCSNPITIEVSPGAFHLWLDPKNPKKIKRGQVAQIHYRALRRNGFIGKIHTELHAPEEVLGLRGRGVTFVGQTDAGSIQVIASDDAPLGRQPFLRLEAVGTVEDEPIHRIGRFLELEITD